MIHAINVQPSRWADEYYLNLGLHLTFLPVCHGSEPPDPGKVKVHDCEFRWRLDPDEETDFRWTYGGANEPHHRAVARLALAYFSRGEPVFERCSTVGSITRGVDLDDVVGNAIDKLRSVPGNIGGPRLALVMVRIHRHQGNLDQARRFARAGLECLGGAGALRAELEQALET